MGAAQGLKEFRLIRVSDIIVYRLEFNAGRTQLIQQYVRGHFQFNSELGDGVTRHSTLSCLLQLFFNNDTLTHETQVSGFVVEPVSPSAHDHLTCVVLVQTGNFRQLVG